MTDTTNNHLVDEYLALVEQAREEARDVWGDDYECQKPPHLLLQVISKEIGVLNAATLEEQNKDFNDAMLAVQGQTVIIGALLASLYELADRHRVEYLDALGELGD